MDTRPAPTASTSAIQTALVRSRQTILTALPLFSTKSRAKSAPQLLQAPHTLVPIATSTISIGPHQFSKTKLFSVEWIEEQASVVAAPPPPPTPFPSDILPGSALPPRTFNPITPSLITRLNAASAADPLLATILRKAATGQATSPELAGLARYIEAMRLDEEANNPAVENGGDTPQTELEPPVASTSNVELSNVTTPRASSKSEEDPNAIVIEFKETPTERYALSNPASIKLPTHALLSVSRYILPSHFTFQLLPAPTATASASAASHPSVLLSFFIFPLTTEKGKGKSTSQEGSVPVPISLVVEECPESLRNILSNASRSERNKDVKMEEWWKKMVSFAVFLRLTPSLNLGLLATDSTRATQDSSI